MVCRFSENGASHRQSSSCSSSPNDKAEFKIDHDQIYAEIRDDMIRDSTPNVKKRKFFGQGSLEGS